MILDTDIFIDLLRGVPVARKFFGDLIKKDGIFSFSALTEAELLSGTSCENDRNREKVLHLLALGEKIFVDNPVAQLAGKIRRSSRASLPDAIIAATAMIKNTFLCTRNIKDFRPIRGLRIKKPY